MSRKLKLSSKAKTAVFVGLAAALSRDTENPVEVAVKIAEAPMTEEDKNKARGLKYFEMPDGSMSLPSVNHKNALRKWTLKNK